MSAQKKSFYITTPIYYVNAKPHIGTLYSTLLADVIARWQRFKGNEVYFLTGTDEHGQKIAQQAALAEMHPQQFVDQMIPAFQSAWERYELSYDRFIRTTELAHKQTVVRWIEQLIAKGDIYKARYEGLYCVPCETFVTQEQAVVVEGEQTCPSCFRGLQKISEENYFFRLSAYQEKLLAFYEQNPNFIHPKERINEILAFVKGGLKDLSISRTTVEWGIPFPSDPEHTVYVWGDALMNYVSALGFLHTGPQAGSRFAQFWPADVQVMAKDIVKFHAVYFPAFLMAVGVQPARRLLVHGYLLVNNDKMSKSKGNALDPLKLADHFGVDQIRFYLVRHMPTNHDGNISVPDIVSRIESDLANNLGNLLQRAASLALKYSATEVVVPKTWSEESKKLHEACNEMLGEFEVLMDGLQLSQAHAAIWAFITKVNVYFHEMEPWKKAKENPAQFSETLAATAQSLYIIGHLISSIMPYKSKQLLASLGHTLSATKEQIYACKWNVPCTYFVPREPLFVRPELPIEYKEAAAELEALAPPQSQPAVKVTHPVTPVVAAVSRSNSEGAAEDGFITIDQLVKVELVIGSIVSCVRVEKSDKMLCMQVDLGSYGVRQILAGVGQSFTPEQLTGKRGLFVANLPPRKMLGMLSQGMMLIAKDGDKISLVSVDDAIAPGSRLC
ncbi:MAG: methionyl-tRNA synthetase [Candidatus Dependentiae bacterium]|nr:methionyl-tRNA synthetase [Candidatus Dependentiae bacterium]